MNLSTTQLLYTDLENHIMTLTNIGQPQLIIDRYIITLNSTGVP